MCVCVCVCVCVYVCVCVCARACVCEKRVVQLGSEWPHIPLMQLGRRSGEIEVPVLVMPPTPHRVAYDDHSHTPPYREAT